MTPKKIFFSIICYKIRTFPSGYSLNLNNKLQFSQCQYVGEFCLDPCFVGRLMILGKWVSAPAWSTWPSYQREIMRQPLSLQLPQVLVALCVHSSSVHTYFSLCGKVSNACSNRTQYTSQPFPVRWGHVTSCANGPWEGKEGVSLLGRDSEELMSGPPSPLSLLQWPVAFHPPRAQPSSARDSDNKQQCAPNHHHDFSSQWVCLLGKQ